MKKLLILAMVLSALLISVPAVAVAETTYVSPGDDIQEIIDAASPGDIIVFALGTYSLSSTLNVNKSLTLTSADPYAAPKPVIDGGGILGTLIYIAADDVTLDGLEIVNGTADLVKSDSPAVSRITVRNCIVHGSSGDEGVQLKHCTDCLIECCVAYDVRQDGFNMAYSSGGTIRNCEVYNSRSENAAIYVYDSYDMTVECNYIHDTQAANGVMFYKNYGATHTIANNLIVRNRWLGGKHCYDEADGNAINIYKPRVYSSYIIKHNTIDDNRPANVCAQPSHAVYVNDGYAKGFATSVDDNIVTNHNGYGIRVFFGAVVNYNYNDLWQNALGATDGNPVDGGGNISANPLYNSDYTLQAGSPCIGAASDGKDMGVLFDECGCAPANTAPVADPNGPYLGAVNTPIAFDGTGSSDPDNDPLTYAWDFGDSNTGTGAAPSHSYTAAGIYDVCLTVNDGTVDSDPVCTIAVVYDPDGGFVTGGGWIWSPPGAYAADPDLEGKATFGFVSKYKKGANVPEGNTEFQFKAGNLNFHSDSYEWLVVANHKAVYKGVGTINGAGNYGFMLSAIDEKLTPSTDVDLFRIKIWDKDDDDTIVYDNKMGAEDDADPTTAIGGGSIVIHKK